MERFKVVEHISGVWSYHLAEIDKYTSLCGKQVMDCNLPFKSWGVKTHLKESYCQICLEIASKKGVEP